MDFLQPQQGLPIAGQDFQPIKSMNQAAQHQAEVVQDERHWGLAWVVRLDSMKWRTNSSTSSGNKLA